MPSSKIQSYEPYVPPTQSNNNGQYNTSTATAVFVDNQDFKPYHQEQQTSYNPSVISSSQPQVFVVAVEHPRYVHIGTRKPVQLTYCPNCAKQHVGTHTKTKVTGTTWVCVLVGVAVFWPLCWVPLVADPMKQTNHYCKNCGVKVGRVKPFQ